MKNRLFTIISLMLILSVTAVMFSSAAVSDSAYYEGTVSTESIEQETVTYSVNSVFTADIQKQLAAGDTADNRRDDLLTAAETDNIPAANTAADSFDDDVETTEKMIAFGRAYTGSISSFYERNAYLFSATERGTFSFNLKHDSFTGAGGWIVTLYSEYYLNGSDGETGLREIGSLICTCDTTSHTSVKYGVLPGSYRAVVSAYGGVRTEEYTLTVSFDACTDFEAECNNTITRYTELYANCDMHGTSSYLTDGTDTDWYMLNMYKTGVISLTFSHTTQKDNVAVGWRVVLYDASGNEIYSENSSISAYEIDSGRLGLQSGVYYIAVYGRVYSDAEYTLKAQRLSTGLYESENNNTPASANAIKTDTFIYGTTSSRQGSADRDYYRFTLDSNGYITLTFNHDEITSATDKRGWNVQVLTEDGTVLYAYTGYYLTNEYTSPRIGLAGGDYYVFVDCDNCYRSSVDYGVCVNFTADDGYETESNNTIETADMLKTGNTVSGNLKTELSGYDSDYYKIELTENSKIDFTFEFPALTSGRTYFTAAVTDEYGNPFEIYSSDGGASEDGSISFDGAGGRYTFSAVIPAGTYYIRISEGDYFSDCVYKLTFAGVTPEGPC